MTLHLRMLGAPALETEQGTTVPGLGPGKPLAVVCYLAVRGSARRDELVALLWGDVDEKRARNAFRQTLHRLRNAVPGLIGPDSGERIQLELSEIRTDLEGFQAAISAGAWQTALDLYGGDFLEGLDLGVEAFAHWADEVRHRVRAQWQGALHAVARAALDAGDVDVAVARARQLGAVDPASEDAIVIEAQALALAGRGTEAATLLEMHAARMRRDFGVGLPDAAADMLRRLRHTVAAQPRASSLPSAQIPNPYEAETAELLRAWRRVTLEERGASLLVEAPAGADPHALMQDVAARITATSQALVLRGHEPSAGADVPYTSVAEALRGALRAPGLAGVSDHLLAEAARLVPELRDRFPLPPAGPIDDEAARVRVFDSVAAVIEAIAYEQPVCIILEDLERAAPATIDLVAYLMRRLRAARVLFIATARQTHAPVARLVREGVIGQRIALNGASDDGWLDPPAESGQPERFTPARMALYAAAAAVLVVAGTLVWASLRAAAGVTGPTLQLADTLLLVDAAGLRATVVSGSVNAPETRTRAHRAIAAEPPWLNAHAAPVGDRMVIERLSPRGTDVYLISAGDTTALAATQDDDLIGGWSPDGQRVLIIRGRQDADGYSAGLWTYPVDGTAPIGIDTTHGRSVVDAVWSPTGARIAWVARVGPGLQREVFVADASGARARNVSAHAGEDYHIAWAPDGARIAFTSDRTGDAEIFVRDLANWELWRITFDPAHDDAARFARDGSLIVFESTRGGMLGIYAVRPFGGEPHALMADAGGMRIERWLAPPPAFIDQVRISAPTIAPGDSARIAAMLTTSEGQALDPIPLQWSAPDSPIVAVRERGDTIVAHARSPGAARLIAELPGWRSDTAIIVVGDGPATWIADDFSVLDGAQWRVLGQPAPIARGDAVVLRADREWPSGIVAERRIPLDRTVDIDVAVRAPFAARAPMSFVIALVQPATLDAVAPQPVHIAAVEWDGSAGRLTFSVGPESASEPLNATSEQHVLSIRVQADGRVSFLVDGRVASVSSLQLRDVAQAQLWIGGVGTGNAVEIDRVRVRIGEATTR